MKRHVSMPPARSLAGSFLLAAALLAAAGCSQNSPTGPYGGSPPPTTTPPNTVVLSGMTFSPKTITIAAGTTITWDNHDSYLHTSTSDGGTWDTGNIAGGAKKTTLFNTPGTYPYHCTYHATMGMTGTVIVN